jgi:hypothetical protein
VSGEAVAVDRRLAVAVLGVCAAALLVVGGTTRAPLAERGAGEEALEHLVTLTELRDRGSWRVEYDYERRLRAGRRLRGRIVEARHGRDHVVVSGAALSGELGGARFECTTTEDGPECLERDGDPSRAVPTAEVYRLAVELGAYVVRRAAGVTAAGEHGRCFELASTGPQLPGLGVRSVQCLAADGVPLRAVVETASGVDARMATRVDRGVSRPALEQLLVPFTRATGHSASGPAAPLGVAVRARR